MEAATEVLIDHSREADTLTRTFVLSLAAHTTVIALVILLPAGWGAAVHDAQPVMMVIIGGEPGPRQGINPISARLVQQVAQDASKPTTQSPSVLSQPDMTEPFPNARSQPRATARTEPRKGERQLHGQTPTSGAEVKQGAATLETYGASFRTGLATGSGATGNAYTDFANFCCPVYLTTMVQLVQRNWQQNQGADGTVVVKFTIRRDGLLADVEVEQQSTPFLNLAAQRAVIATRQLPPLPAAFSGDHLTVHLVFQFQR